MLTPPNHAKNAKADVKGWRDPQTGELLVAKRHSLDEVLEYNKVAFPKMIDPHTFEVIETITLEDIMDNTEVEETEEVLEPELDELTKNELIDLAEERGVEVSKSWTKAKLIEVLQDEA